MVPHHRGQYSIRERESFQSDWRSGVIEGWINQLTDPTTLEGIKRILSESPRIGAPVPEEPENVRRVRFPRSVADPIGRMEVRYEVIEDDTTVWLLSVEKVS